MINLSIVAGLTLVTLGTIAVASTITDVMEQGNI